MPDGVVWNSTLEKSSSRVSKSLAETFLVRSDLAQTPSSRLVRSDFSGLPGSFSRKLH